MVPSFAPGIDLFGFYSSFEYLLLDLLHFLKLGTNLPRPFIRSLHTEPRPIQMPSILLGNSGTEASELSLWRVTGHSTLRSVPGSAKAAGGMALTRDWGRAPVGTVVVAEYACSGSNLPWPLEQDCPAQQPLSHVWPFKVKFQLARSKQFVQLSAQPSDHPAGGRSPWKLQGQHVLSPGRAGLSCR